MWFIIVFGLVITAFGVWWYIDNSGIDHLHDPFNDMMGPALIIVGLGCIIRGIIG